MAKQKNPAFGDKIITGEARCSFPKIAEPDNSKFGQGKYSIDGIFEDPAQMKSLKDGCIAHAKSFYKTEDVSDIKFPWRDGNELSKYGGYEGNTFVRAKCKNQPIVVDSQRKPLDPGKVYGGAVVRLNVTPLAYELEDEIVVIEDGVKTKKKEVIKGVTVMLNAVQFVKDAEGFGAGGSDGFDNAYNEQEETDPNGGF